jgi:hypothetical protein
MSRSADSEELADHKILIASVPWSPLKLDLSPAGTV